MKSVAFFTNKGGVGKTTLVCNIAAYLATKYEKKILVVDADPQSNASQYMFSDDELVRVYEKNAADTVYTMARPLTQGKGYSESLKYSASKNFGVDVLIGDPRFALVEDTLASDWSASGVRSIRTTFLFRQFLIKNSSYDYVFFDMGPSLGSINRSVLLACDYFLIPMSVDPFSIKASENISTWISSWAEVLKLKLNPAFVDRDDVEIKDLDFRLRLLGYVSQQYTFKRDASGNPRAVKAYDKIMAQIGGAIDKVVAALNSEAIHKEINYSLGQVPNLHSLVPMSQTSRKPIFMLKAADGIVGAHFSKVAEADDLFGKICSQLISNIEEMK